MNSTQYITFLKAAAKDLPDAADFRQETRERILKALEKESEPSSTPSPRRPSRG